jgi:hypothetical protein
MSKRLPRPPRPRRVGDLPRVHSQISVVKVTARSRGLPTLACNCDSLTCSREDSAITVGSHFGSRRTALQRDRLPSGIGLTASSARMKGPTPGDPHHHRRLGAFVAEPCTGNTVLSGVSRTGWGRRNRMCRSWVSAGPPHISHGCSSTFRPSHTAPAGPGSFAAERARRPCFCGDDNDHG